MKTIFSYFKKLNQHELGSLAIVVGLIGLTIGLSFLAPENNSTTEIVTEIVAEVKPDTECQNRRALDGVCTDSESLSLPVYAVMIDNNIVARPPSGLDQASLVYEAIAEGTITRFLAVFDQILLPEKIGPVRSARPYFVDWAEEFNALYAHVGGSPDALEQLYGSAVFDLNQFFNGPYFWRDNSRQAPHNVYISKDLLAQAVAEKQWQLTSHFNPWNFKPDSADSDRPEHQEISIDFGSFAHTVDWKYNQAENNYLRYQAGTLHLTEAGKVILAKNVAVMYTKSIPIDDYGRRATTTIGSGRAIVFQDGKATEAIWRRQTKEDRTRFYNHNEAEISFNAGTTWIEVVPDHYPEIEYE